SPRASTVATTTWGVPRMAGSWASPAAAAGGAAMGPAATTTEPGAVAAAPVAGSGEGARPARFTPGKGIGAESADGRWAIQASLRAGLLATVVHPHAPGEATEVGMELRRLRALFTGHAFGEHNRYFFHLGFAPRDLGH